MDYKSPMALEPYWCETSAIVQGGGGDGGGNNSKIIRIHTVGLFTRFRVW